MASPRAARMRKSVDIWEDVQPDQSRPQGDRKSFDSDGLTDVGIAESIEKLDSELRDLQDLSKRNFSSTTAIRIDDNQPLTDDESDSQYEQEPHVEIRYHYDDDPFSEDDGRSESEAASRKLSGAPTISTMPEELDIPASRSYRSPLSIRAAPNSTPKRQAHHSRLLSSPTRSAQNARHFSPATPTNHKDRFVSSPLARNTSSGFRRPSSVRGMQLSSPSPPPSMSPRFAQSPRSARQRQMEEEEEYHKSRSGTPSQHPNPDKEYPLILLHCSFNLILPDYPAVVLDAVLPPWIKHNLSMLREKVNSMVIERGVLVAHPGEDFELLEERMLESLELKRPRVGKCGHFIDLKDETLGDGDTTTIHNDLANFEHAPATCTTCFGPIQDHHRGCSANNPTQRFDLRIFAANGLLRAGAWSAAWREMEKVDVEIGIWIPEDVRQELEQRTAEHELQWEDRGLERVRDLRMEMPYAPTPPMAPRSRQVTAMTLSMDSTERSPASRAMPKARRTTRSFSTRKQRSSVDDRSGTRSAKQEVPLSTLLANYVRRKTEPSWDLFLQITVIILAVILFRQWWSPPATIVMPAQMLAPMPGPNSAAIDLAKNDSMASHTESSPVVLAPASTVTITSTQMASATADAVLPACTFSPDDAGEHGMTALPADLASKVLDAELSSTASGLLPAITDLVGNEEEPLLE